MSLQKVKDRFPLGSQTNYDALITALLQQAQDEYDLKGASVRSFIIPLHSGVTWYPLPGDCVGVNKVRISSQVLTKLNYALIPSRKNTTGGSVSYVVLSDSIVLDAGTNDNCMELSLSFQGKYSNEHCVYYALALLSLALRTDGLKDNYLEWKKQSDVEGIASANKAMNTFIFGRYND